MDKSTKPDFLREARLQDCLDFLDKLRKSGVTNMFDVRQTLRQAFPISRQSKQPKWWRTGCTPLRLVLTKRPPEGIPNVFEREESMRSIMFSERLAFPV
jgi:hypothetical protein